MPCAFRKKSEHQQTREQRAKRIEDKLVGMEERIEELQAERHRNKPVLSAELACRSAGGKPAPAVAFMASFHALRAAAVDKLDYRGTRDVFQCKK